MKSWPLILIFCSSCAYFSELKRGFYKNENKQLKTELKSAKGENKLIRERIRYKERLEREKKKKEELLLQEKCHDQLSSSCYQLADFYQKENKDYKVIKVYRPLCLNQSDQIACYRLGKLYQEKKSLASAKKFYQKACELSHGDSCNSLADLLINQRKFSKALRFFNHGCELDSSKSCYNLGSFYQGQKKKKLAIKAFTQGCLLGDQPSCEKKIGIKKQKFLNHIADFSIKCDKNLPLSCYNLAYAYLALAQEEESLQYFNKACHLGDRLSCGYSAAIKKNRLKAKEVSDYYKVFCEKGDAEKCFMVACLHGLLKNDFLTMSYLEKAFSKGFGNWKRVEDAIELDLVRYSPEYKDLEEAHRKDE